MENDDPQKADRKQKEYFELPSEFVDSTSDGSASASLVDRMHERIRELEALLGGKDEALQVALQGLDNATSVEKGYRTQLEGYRTRIGEFQDAVQQRDQVIQQLSSSLEQTLRERDDLAQDGERLVQEVSLLRSQLQATSEVMAKGSTKTQLDFMVLQNKMLALEDTIKKRDSEIENLQTHILDQQFWKKELELKKSEFDEYKIETASHVQQLMQEVEHLHQEAAKKSALERQRENHIIALEKEHRQQMATLQAELEEHFGRELVQIQEKHRSQFTKQLETLNKHHVEELTNMQQYHEERNRLNQVVGIAPEQPEELLHQLSLYKEKVQNLAEMLSRADKKLGSLKDENFSLNEQVKTLSESLDITQKERERVFHLYNEAQTSEISWKKQVESLQVELNTVSKAAEEYTKRWNTFSQNHQKEVDILKESHAQELKFLSEQLEGMKSFTNQIESLQTTLQETREMEKRLQGELQMSICREEDLKGQLLQCQDEIQDLKVVIEKHKEQIQQQVNFEECLKIELAEKQKNELILREELKTLKDSLKNAKDTNVSLYKEQVDKLNEQLRQKSKLEEILKIQVHEKEQLEEALRKGLEEQMSEYKEKFHSFSTQLHEKTISEARLKNELQESMLSGEKMQEELKSLKKAVEDLKKGAVEADICRKQIDVLNRQLSEQSKSKSEIVEEYETRIKVLTKKLESDESSNRPEFHAVLMRESEGVQCDLLLETTQVQDYKEKINELNNLVLDKQKMESILTAKVDSMTFELVSLKENLLQLESLNADLEERLRSERSLQEELIAAAKIHKDQVGVLSAKISELSSQQNSLDNGAISMRQEMEVQKSYIHNLEMMKEQVSESSKTKEALINDLSLCIKSLTEDNSSYQEKLEALSKRLDDECRRADDNMLMRETFENEIILLRKHKNKIAAELKEALWAKDEQLKKISHYEMDFQEVKQQLKHMNDIFSAKFSELQGRSSNLLSNTMKKIDILYKKLNYINAELTKYKDSGEQLSRSLPHKKKIEKDYESQLLLNKREVESLKTKLFEENALRKEQGEKMALYLKELRELKEIHCKLAKVEEEKYNEGETHKKELQCLQESVAAKTEIIARLNIQLEEAACKFEDLKQLFDEAQERFSRERELNLNLSLEKEAIDTGFKVEFDHDSETRQMELDEFVNDMSTLGAQDMTFDKNSSYRDSVNLNSISETELLQLESKLQKALDERNEIEKSFKDHINKLAESHAKEIALYQEQLQDTVKKLHDVTEAHKDCFSEKDSLKIQIDILISNHCREIDLFRERLQKSSQDYNELLKMHKDFTSEEESMLTSSSEDIEKYRQEIRELKARVAETSAKLEHLSKHHADCVLRKDFYNEESVNKVDETENEGTVCKENNPSIPCDSHTLSKSTSTQSVPSTNVFGDCNPELEISKFMSEHHFRVSSFINELVRAVGDWENMSISEKKAKDKTSLKEYVQKLSESYHQELELFTEQFSEIKKRLIDVANQLRICSSENLSLKDLISYLSFNLDDMSLKEKLCVDKLKWVQSTPTRNLAELESAGSVSSTSGTSGLGIEDTDLQIKSEDYVMCQRELVQTRQFMDILKLNVQSEISKVHVELQNLINICIPSVELIHENAKFSPSSSSTDFRVQSDSENLSCSQKDKNRSLEESFICAATIHHDVSSLQNHIECLVADLNSMRQKNTETEEVLAAKIQREKILDKQIEDFERDIKRLNDERQSLQYQLENLTVKLLATESLLAGKVEAEHSLQNEISNVESSECNNCEHLLKKITELTTEVQVVEKKVENMSLDYTKVVEEYKALEAKYATLCVEKSNLEKVVENLKAKQDFSSKSLVVAEWSFGSKKDLTNSATESSGMDGGIKDSLIEHRCDGELHREIVDVDRLSEIQNEILPESTLSSSCKEEMSSINSQEKVQSTKEDWVTFAHSQNLGNLSALKIFDSSILNNLGQQEMNSDGNSAIYGAEESSCTLNDRRSSLHVVVLRLLQQSDYMNKEKKALVTECDSLRKKLEEREAQELLFNEELAAACSRCQALEQQLEKARSNEPSRESLSSAKLALECDLHTLEGQNNALKLIKVSLEDELCSLREENRQLKLMVTLKDKVAGAFCEEAVSSTELVLLKEHLHETEREKQTLQKQVEALETTKQDLLKQVEVFLEEARHTRKLLEDAWQERADAEEQLGRARCELALAGLRKDSSKARDSVGSLLDGDSRLFNMQREVHGMVEEMAQEVVNLRHCLNVERAKNEHVKLSQNELEIQQKLEIVLKSNSELLEEKRALLVKLSQEQSLKVQESSDTPSDLVLEQSVSQDQINLSDAIGVAGALQETLRQQKEELLARLQEKEVVEDQLNNERAELKCSKLQVQLLQQQLTDKDVLYQELIKQNTCLEKELEKLEQRLREREQMLHAQRTQLQTELRAQDLALRRWKLEERTSKVEKQLESSLRQLSGISECSEGEEEKLTAQVQAHLETVQREMRDAHAEALLRLKHCLESEFSVREEALKASFSAEISNIQASHKEQLAVIQQDLLAAEKELENLRNSEILKTLADSNVVTEDISESKKNFEQKLELIHTSLKGEQITLFQSLKKLFDDFTQQLLLGLNSLHQKQQEERIKREVSILECKHQQEIKQLETSMENKRKKNLEDLQMEVKKINEEKQIMSSPAVPLQRCSSHPSLVAFVQLKHLLYSEFTSNLQDITKDWSEKWKNEMSVLLEALETNVEEETFVEELPEGSSLMLSQSLAEKSNTLSLEEKLRSAEELVNKAENMLKYQVHSAEKVLQDIRCSLNPLLSFIMKHMSTAIMQVPPEKTEETNSSEEKDQYRQLAQKLSAEQAAETERLREMLAQLESQHTREMEELRQYFEQKVQELEKHYSEEITSHHSRRVSSSSCDSDSEFSTDALLGTGDHALSRIPPLTHICESCAADPGYKEVEEHWSRELAKRVEESRAQLSSAKKELEAFYETELSALKEHYEDKLKVLAQELTCVQQTAVRTAKTNVGRQLQAQWRKEIRAIRSHLISGNFNSIQIPIQGSDPIMEVENIDIAHINEAEELEYIDDICLELSSQLRQLESIFIQSLQLQKQQFENVKENDKSEVHSDVQFDITAEHELFFKVHMEEKLRQEVREELEKELEEQVEKIAQMMMNNAEAEQKMFIENQSQMMKEFLEQHRKDLETLKQQHKMELDKARQFTSLHNEQQANIHLAHTDQQRVTRLTEQTSQIADGREVHDCFTKKDKEVQTDKAEIQIVPVISQEVQTSSLKLLDSALDISTDILRAQPFNVDSVSFDIDAPSLPGGEVSSNIYGRDDFHITVAALQTEYRKCIECMFGEWLEMLKKIEVGQTLGLIKNKFLSEEYMSECCSKIEKLLHVLKNLHSEERNCQQENLPQQISVCTSPIFIEDESARSQSSLQICASIISERDRWRQVGLVLKKLVEELLLYLEECEDEVNNTLLNESNVSAVESTVVHGTSKVVTLESVPSTPLRSSSVTKGNKRVHFAPSCNDFKMIISNDKLLLDCIQEDKDLSAKLRVELDACLEHLRSEAANLMENYSFSAFNSPCKRQCGEAECAQITPVLTSARRRIIQLETERNTQHQGEEVAEGFGEQPSLGGASLGLRLQTLTQLQLKARSLLSGGRPTSSPEVQQLQLLDEICYEGDRLAEEALREREDLQLQVESADKRLRDTRKFLEDQAAEREQERDEFQQEVSRLQEQIKAKEKELAEQQRITREMEVLEQQYKEAMTGHQQMAVERDALQGELKAAVDKVWLLRDVVSELELQAEAKDLRATHLESHIQELLQKVEELEHSRQTLLEEIECLRTESAEELSRQITALEEQLQAHKLQAEQCQPVTLKQMRTLIRDIEASVDKRTHQLEALHVSSSTQSSPSEDISVRDIIQCESPEDLRATVSSLQGSPLSPLSPPPMPLPLRDLTRLQESLQKHTRAEEAALKWIKDLQMELKSSQKAQEEACAERDLLQERVSDQLLRIASLEASVDAGRWKDTSNTNDVDEDEEEEEDIKELEALQHRAQDAERESENLAEELAAAQKEIEQMKETISQMQITASEQEKMLCNRLKCEEESNIAVRERYEMLRHEIDELRRSYGPGSGNRLIPLPALFDALMADKNAEIDALRQRLKEGGDGGRRAKSVTCLCPHVAKVSPGDHAGAAANPPSHTYRGGGDDDDDTQSRTSASRTDATHTSGQTTSTTPAFALEKHEEVKTLRSQLVASQAQVACLRAEVATLPALQMQARAEQQRADELAARMEELQRHVRELEEDRSSSDALLQQVLDLNARLKMADAEHERAETLQAKLDILREEMAVQAKQLSEKRVVEVAAQEEESKESVALLNQRIMELQQLLSDTARERDELRRMTDSSHGIEELTGQVTKELEECAQLDSSLLNHISEVEEKGLHSAPSGVKVIATQESESFVSEIQQEVLQMVDGWPFVTRQSLVLSEQLPETSTSNQRSEDAELIKKLQQALEEMKIEAKENAERELQLQRTIAFEKEHAEDLQRALRLEQQRALDLQSQLASQAVRAGLAVDESRLKQSSWEVEQERAKVHALEMQLKFEHATLQQLKSKLLSERQRFNTLQQRDAELLQTMRLRLNAANANKRDISTSPPNEHIPCSPLSKRNLIFPMTEKETAKEIPHIPKSPQKEKFHIPSNSASKPLTSSLEAGDSVNPPWVPAGIHSELQQRLCATEEEVKDLCRKYNREKEASQKLRAELTLLRRHNHDISTQLSEVRSSLAMSEAENDRLSRRLRTLEEAELRQQNLASTERSLIQEKLRQLEANVVRLETDLEVERAVREDTLAENANLQDEIVMLRRQLENIPASHIEAKQKSPISKTISPRFKNVDIALENQMSDRSKAALTLARLVEERQEYQQKMKFISEQLSIIKEKEADAQAKILLLSTEKSTLTEECIQLRLELARTKGILYAKMSKYPNLEELEECATRSFGNYLRAESYRKALVWQKKYLLIVLGAYKSSETSTFSQLTSLSRGAKFVDRVTREDTREPQVRFRTAALAVVAVLRMKFLVKRWSSSPIKSRNELYHDFADSHWSVHHATSGTRGSSGGSFATSSTWSLPASASPRVVLHSPPCQDHCSSHAGPSTPAHWKNRNYLSGTLNPSQLAQFVDFYDAYRQHQ